MMEVLEYGLALLVTLGILVTIHELGHFVLARRSGVHVVRFSVGFGSPLWSRTDRHGTEFALAALPLGGYVRMLDERELEPGMPVPGKTYQQLSVGWRIAIALGGPVANFVLAFVVFWAVAIIGTSSLAPVITGASEGSPLAAAGVDYAAEVVSVDGRPAQSWTQVNLRLADRLGESGVIELGLAEPGGDPDAVRLVTVPIDEWHAGVSEPKLLESVGLVPAHLPYLGAVVVDSAADRAGLRPGDLITAVDGKPVTLWDDWSGAVQKSPEEPLTLSLRRDGRDLQLTLIPDKVENADGEVFGRAGVHNRHNTIHHGVLGGLAHAVDETITHTAMTLGFIRKMVAGLVSVKNLGGPLTIAVAAGDSAKSGWRYYVAILAMLSISLGVINLMPIPMLDGGHVLFCLAEWVMGKPLSERVQLIGLQVGMFLVAGLMVLVFYNDITRFF